MIPLIELSHFLKEVKALTKKCIATAAMTRHIPKLMQHHFYIISDEMKKS